MIKKLTAGDSLRNRPVGGDDSKAERRRRIKAASLRGLASRRNESGDTLGEGESGGLLGDQGSEKNGERTADHFGLMYNRVGRIVYTEKGVFRD